MIKSYRERRRFVGLILSKLRVYTETQKKKQTDYGFSDFEISFTNIKSLVRGTYVNST